MCEDLMTFFHNFFERYPEYEDREIYIASKDFGAHYAIYLAKYM